MMKFRNFLISSLVTLIFSTAFTGCRDMLHDINAISADVSGLKSLSMIEIEDVTNGSTTGISPFSINAYETTYILWYETWEWGKSNGFTFIKPAEAGNTGSIGKPELYSYFPVTSLHPADIFVWCNALSVKNGLTPVYYKDSSCTEVLKSSLDVASEKYTTENTLTYDMSTGKLLVMYDFTIAKNVYQKLDADGYRLPTAAEWKYAAQGAKRTSKDSSYKFSGSNDLSEVAVHDQMRIPGSLKANGIGTYDMSGNVCEFSMTGTESSGVLTLTNDSVHCYGGHYANDKDSLFSVQSPYDLKNIISGYSYLVGFRLARSI